MEDATDASRRRGRSDANAHNDFHDALDRHSGERRDSINQKELARYRIRTNMLSIDLNCLLNCQYNYSCMFAEHLNILTLRLDLEHPLNYLMRSILMEQDLFRFQI